MQLQPVVAEALNRHINAEQYAAHFYRALGIWADAQAYPGLRAHAFSAADEEAAHAQAFIDYAGDRGIPALYDVAAPPATFITYADAVTAALTVEEAVSASLLLLHDAAEMAKDPPTCLLAATWLREEQVGAEKQLRDVLIILGRGAPVDLLDREVWS